MQEKFWKRKLGTNTKEENTAKNLEKKILKNS